MLTLLIAEKQVYSTYNNNVGSGSHTSLVSFINANCENNWFTLPTFLSQVVFKTIQYHIL